MTRTDAFISTRKVAGALRVIGGGTSGANVRAAVIGPAGRAQLDASSINRPVAVLSGKHIVIG